MLEGPPHLLPPAETEQPDDFVLERADALLFCIATGLAIILGAVAYGAWQGWW